MKKLMLILPLLLGVSCDPATQGPCPPGWTYDDSNPSYPICGTHLPSHGFVPLTGGCNLGSTPGYYDPFTGHCYTY